MKKFVYIIFVFTPIILSSCISTCTNFGGRIKRTFHQIFFLLVIAVSLILIPNNIYGQENDAESKDKLDRGTTLKKEINYENTESFNNPQFFKRKEKEPRPNWVKALHEARANGDEKLMRKLERENIPPSTTVGENVVDYSTESSGTIGFPGEPEFEENPSDFFEDWATDIHIRSSNTSFRESHPAMATSSNGTIYIIWENFGSTSYAYLQIYYSTDAGNNWEAFGYIENSNFDLSQPSIAIGEGGENYLVIAWVAESLVPHIEVGYTPLTFPMSLTVVVPPYLDFWDSYQKPVIWTDSYDYSGWYAYLTCEGTYHEPTSSISVCFWRSVDYCATFEYALTGGPPVIWSGTWLDPDGTYGTLGDDIFLTCFNASDNHVYVIKSTDFGATFTPGSEYQISFVSPLPSHAVDPDIAAAVYNDNIMLCCTKVTSGDDDIGQCYSTDAGVSWSSFYTLEGMTDVNEWAAELNANEGGDTWHLCYTSQDWWVYYNTRPQDLSTYWRLIPDIVNDVDWASANYTKKAITSNWVTNDPGIAWSDYRDAVTDDYDIYFDNSSGETTFQLSVSVANGWNMVSAPGLHPTNQSVTTWWPNLTGSVFGFNIGYYPVTTTATGEGYWMKNSGAETYNHTVNIVSHIPIPVVAGWNMFGGYEDVVDVTTITTNPSGQLVLPIYEYQPGTGYGTATDLVPGNGYWVKIISACDVIIPDIAMTKGSGEKKEDYFKEEWGRIVILDAEGKQYTLYSVTEEVDLNRYELPPMPPAGMFDIRFSSGRIAEDLKSAIQSIEMSGVTYPIIVRVENIGVTLQNESGKVLNEELNPGDEVTISNPIDKLMVSSSEYTAPVEYQLEHNYPNPFNPATNIKYSIPEASFVRLKVYDILGNEVATLVNEEQSTGIYKVELDASALPSGVYFYRIQAGSFVETKKMVLMK